MGQIPPRLLLFRNQESNRLSPIERYCLLFQACLDPRQRSLLQPPSTRLTRRDCRWDMPALYGEKRWRILLILFMGDSNALHPSEKEQVWLKCLSHLLPSKAFPLKIPGGDVCWRYNSIGGNIKAKWHAFLTVLIQSLCAVVCHNYYAFIQWYQFVEGRYGSCKGKISGIMLRLSLNSYLSTGLGFFFSFFFLQLQLYYW